LPKSPKHIRWCRVKTDHILASHARLTEQLSATVSYNNQKKTATNLIRYPHLPSEVVQPYMIVSRVPVDPSNC